jgi:hypothetical protein
MPTILDIASEMTGQIPGLARLMAAKFVNLAMEQLQQEYLWSWNTGEGIMIIPDGISAGSVAVTKFSPTITFDATAVTALNASGNNPAITDRQFRLPNGPIYNILAYNSSTGVSTLDRIYMESTNAAAGYNVYKVYYGPPSSDGTTPNVDFLRHLSILNYTQGYTIAGRRLYMTQAQLNGRDPLRGAFGQPYYLAAYKQTPNNPANANAANQGFMQYELWPHCVLGQGLKSIYERRHVDIPLSGYLPVQASYPVIKYRAFEHGYRWALQNAGRIPELKGVDWRFMLADVKKQYLYELVGAKRNDKEILTNIFEPGAGLNSFLGPIDANFWQSHDVPNFGY